MFRKAALTIIALALTAQFAFLFAPSEDFKATNTKSHSVDIKDVKPVQEPKLPKREVVEEGLKVDLDSMPAPFKKLKVLKLEKDNVLIMKGVFTEESVSKIQQDMVKMSLSLSSRDPIYLVIDSPGGSVPAGLSLIESLKAIPQKVQTITIFAASMGFSTVQALDKRYIVPNGTLMAHRASLHGFGGTLNGNFETRLSMIKRQVTYIEAMASSRMELSLKEYQNMILDEYWIHGFDAVSDKAADEQVRVRCGKSLSGTKKLTFNTIFGRVIVTVSKCPIISGMLEVDFGGVHPEHRNQAKKFINTMFNDKRAFIKEYILTNKIEKILK